MRVKVSKIKILDELYTMRDKEQADYDERLKAWRTDMKIFADKAMEALRLALTEIEAGYGIYGEGEDESTWRWNRNGIYVEVDGSLPQKPNGVNYKLTRTIAMLERHESPDLTVGEDHDIIRLLT